MGYNGVKTSPWCQNPTGTIKVVAVVGSYVVCKGLQLIVEQIAKVALVLKCATFNKAAGHAVKVFGFPAPVCCPPPHPPTTTSPTVCLYTPGHSTRRWNASWLARHVFQLFRMLQLKVYRPGGSALLLLLVAHFSAKAREKRARNGDSWKGDTDQLLCCGSFTWTG